LGLVWRANAGVEVIRYLRIEVAALHCVPLAMTCGGDGAAIIVVGGVKEDYCGWFDGQP